MDESHPLPDHPMKVLITAGATRNPLDAVRLLTANATGRTGVAIATRLRDQGHEVHVLGSPEAVLRAEATGISAEEYGSTTDLMRRMEEWVRTHPNAAVIHSAAVGDYQLPAATDPSQTKIPSGQDRLQLELVRAPKIADHLRGWGLSGFYVTFKAASPTTSDAELREIAAAQRARTGCDLVFANVLGRIEHGIWLVGEPSTHFETRGAAISGLVERVCLGR